MNHPILDLHDNIGWDMDKTLVKGPNSEFFREYIMAHPQKTHRIITFRDRDWASRAYDELEYHGLRDARRLISSIENCPEQWHDYYMIATYPHYAGRRDFLLATGQITQEFLNECVHNFLRFKGSRCKEMGCTVLVDDLPEWVMHGVNDHAIDFVHALHPIKALV